MTQIQERIAYRSGYKYQLAEDYATMLHFLPPCSVDHAWFTIRPDGAVTVRAGYAWDGPSGPTLDTPDSMRGALLHDVLYQALREKLLPQYIRPLADRELEIVCRSDGMIVLRAKAWRIAVRLAGGPAARRDKTIMYAPR